MEVTLELPLFSERVRRRRQAAAHTLGHGRGVRDSAGVGAAPPHWPGLGCPQSTSCCPLDPSVSPSSPLRWLVPTGCAQSEGSILLPWEVGVPHVTDGEAARFSVKRRAARLFEGIRFLL